MSRAIRRIAVLIVVLQAAQVFAQTPQYTWRNVQIFGGGFIPGIVFSQTEPNLIYTRTDIGGAYRFDPAPVGPRGRHRDHRQSANLRPRLYRHQRPWHFLRRRTVSFSSATSAYLCALCVEWTINAENAEIRRGPQRREG